MKKALVRFTCAGLFGLGILIGSGIWSPAQAELDPGFTLPDTRQTIML